MAARSIFLGTTAVAALALVGCNNSNDGFAGSAEAGPLGTLVGVPVNVMSSDHQNSVRVSDQLATVTLDELEVDEFGNITGFTVTLGLPDGTEVTFGDDNSDLNDVGFHAIGGRGPALLAEVENDAGDVVQVAIGFDPLALNSRAALRAAPSIDVDDALFVLARVDAAEAANGDATISESNGIHEDDFNVYMLTGNETETLPSGSGFYFGDTVATVYVQGDLLSSEFLGGAFVTADFGNSQVDIALDGTYTGDVGYGELQYDYVLVGEDIPVDGSRYAGVLSVAGFNADYFSEFTTSEWVPATCDSDVCDGPTGSWEVINSVDIAGDVLGAFYGEAAQATAGVFAATETEHEELINGADVEIVGGYGAYAEELPTLCCAAD